MDPRDFQQVATNLAAAGNPAETRSAISRCYYAAFNVAREFVILGHNRVASGPSAHGKVPHYLNNCGDLTIAAVSSKLGDLHGLRIKADYSMDNRYVEIPSTALFNVKIAESIINDLDACMGDAARYQKTAEGIKAYKESINEA